MSLTSMEAAVVNNVPRINTPKGAKIRSVQSHPLLGILRAEFTVSNAVGDGRPGDGETWVWERPAD